MRFGGAFGSVASVEAGAVFVFDSGDGFDRLDEAERRDFRDDLLRPRPVDFADRTRRGSSRVKSMTVRRGATRSEGPSSPRAARREHASRFTSSITAITESVFAGPRGA